MRAALVLLLAAGAARADTWGAQGIADIGFYCGPDAAARLGCALFGVRGFYEEEEGPRATTITLALTSDLGRLKATLGTDSLRRIAGVFDVGYYSSLSGFGASTSGISALLSGGPHFGVNVGMVGFFLQAGITIELQVTPALAFHQGFALAVGIGPRLPVGSW